MKFRLVETLTYPWPVEVHIPDAAKAGNVLTQSFEMTFVSMSRDEAKASDETYRSLTTAEERADHEVDLLRRVSAGWNDEVVDDDGEPVAFSPKAFEQALQTPWFRNGVFIAYTRSLAANPRLGN